MKNFLKYKNNKTMKYRKKPVVIEAEIFDRNNWDKIVEFTNGHAKDIIIEKRFGGSAYCTITTLEGNMTATEGDYIIKGVNGEFYPLKPDIFVKTYDLI